MRKLFFLICLALPLIAQAELDKEKGKAYRWVGKDGSVHFSSTPPPGVKATEIELHQPGTVIHQENRPQMLEQGRIVGEQVDARLEERQQLIQQIDATQAALAEANEALLKGEAPQPGEVRRRADGGTRLSEAYHQRREAEAKQVKVIEQQLDALYRQLDQLR